MRYRAHLSLLLHGSADAARHVFRCPAPVPMTYSISYVCKRVLALRGRRARGLQSVVYGDNIYTGGVHKALLCARCLPGCPKLLCVGGILHPHPLLKWFRSWVPYLSLERWLALLGLYAGLPCANDSVGGHLAKYPSCCHGMCCVRVGKGVSAPLFSFRSIARASRTRVWRLPRFIMW